MFVAKDQEYTDIHTGVTLAFGEHAGADPNAVSFAPRSGWLRVSVPGQKGEPPRISTIQFRAGNIVGSDKNLTATEKPVEVLPEEQSNAPAAPSTSSVPRYDVRGAVKDDSPTEEVAPTKKKKHY